MRRVCLILLSLTVCIALVGGCTKTSPTEPGVVPKPGPVASQAGKDTDAGKASDAQSGIRVLMVPKIKGIDYFNACEKGAKEAADELGGIDLTFDGPTSRMLDPSEDRPWRSPHHLVHR